MENEIIKKEDMTPDQRKDYNKKSWIKRIHMKRVQGVPLNTDDWSFLVNMMSSDGNEDYAKLIRVDAELVQKAIEEVKDDLEPVDYIKALQGQIHLKSALYRNMKQGQRDDAITRKMDVDTLNKYSKIAMEKGYDKRNPLRVKMEEALKERRATIIDITDKEDKDE
jgi:hypothetical protein